MRVGACARFFHHPSALSELEDEDDVNVICAEVATLGEGARHSKEGTQHSKVCGLELIFGGVMRKCECRGWIYR